MTATPNMYRSTPRESRRFAMRCAHAGTVPFIQSSPGIGKSSIVRSIAKELNLSLIDHRLSTSAPEDLTGLPRFDEDGRARFAPFADLFPIEGDTIPEGFDGWLIFLDEFNSAPKSVQAAAYKLILDGQIGQHNLHSNVIIMAAGNLSTDRAITTSMSTAMQSRLIHIEMEANFKEWLEDVALVEKYDDRIIAYLNYKQSALMDFRPEHQEKTFCCPRTWEFMNNLIQGHDVTEKDAGLYAGTITSGVAVDFIQFTKVYKNMISIKEIVSDPSNCPIPAETGTRWAVICHMMANTENGNFSSLAEYADRFDITFRILFYRSVMIQDKTLRSHPAFIKAMSALSAYLND